MPNQYGFFDCDAPPVRGRFVRLPLDRTAAMHLKIRRTGKSIPGDANKGVRELVADIVDKKEGKRIGCFHGFIFDMATLPYDTSLAVKNKKSKELRDFASDLAGHMIKGSSDLVTRELLYLSRIEILPLYRGNLYGIKATKAIAHFCLNTFRAALCFMEPFPLQYEKASCHRIAETRTSRIFKKDNAKLIRYYQKHLPIKKLSPSSHYYYFRTDQLN